MKTKEEIDELIVHIEWLVKEHKLNNKEHQILFNMLEEEHITKDDLTRKAIYLD